MKIPDEIAKRIVYEKPKRDDHEDYPTICKIKPLEEYCDDCHKYVQGRTLQHKYHMAPKSHWRTYCTSCKCFKNPFTDKFELTNSNVSSFFREYLKKNK